MNLHNFAYYWIEAFKSLYRNSLLCLAAVCTMIISLLILGSALLLVLNVNQLTDQVESGVEISVFLEDDLSGDELESLGERIKYLGGVQSVNFISRYRALGELKDSFGTEREVLDGLEENNTLPNSYRIKALSTNRVSNIARKIEGLEGVEKVRYGREVVEQLMIISRWVRISGLAIVVLLGIAAIFLIATTIRLSVYARRQEIGIMKILGATNWFIRMPFILEGMVLGILGGLIAAGMVYLGYHTLVVKVSNTLPFLELISQSQTMINYTLLGLVAMGLSLGIMGSAISVRRFLKV